jgi:outer membrane protein W
MNKNIYHIFYFGSMSYFCRVNNTLTTMRKTILMAAATVMAAMGANAQEKQEYGNFDFEIGFTAPVAAAVHKGAANSIAPFVYLEGRWQLEQQPVDVGFQMSLSVVNRKFEGGNEDSYRTFPILAVADWQFGRGKKINPYVGLGMGVAQTLIVDDSSTWDSEKWSFAASPRLGVRLFRTVNVSTGWLLTRKDYSRVYCNLGFYF